MPSFQVGALGATTRVHTSRVDAEAGAPHNGNVSNKQGFLQIAVALAVVVLTFALGSAYLWVLHGHRLSQPSVAPHSSASSLAKPTVHREDPLLLPTGDKIRYVSRNCGYSIEFPGYVHYSREGTGGVASCNEEWFHLTYKLGAVAPVSGDMAAPVLPGGLSMEFSPYELRGGQSVYDILVKESKEDGPSHINLSDLKPLTTNGIKGYLVKIGDAYNRYEFALHNQRLRLAIGFGGSDPKLVEAIIQSLTETSDITIP